MNFRLFCAIALLQLVSARFDFLPKFFGQDSAVIVDVNRAPVHAAPKHHQQQQRHHQQQQQHHQQQQHQQKQQRYHPSHYFRSPPMHYPAYQIIPNNNRQIQAVPSKPTQAPTTIAAGSTTIATSVAIFTKDEFPNDLLDIARNKLGIKNLDEIPSISELGELLGTQSADETIKYIRELTATEEGIEFVKAYIESTDYTDSTGTVTRTGTGAETGSQESSTAAAPTAAKPTDVSSEAPQPPTPSLYERLSAYLNVFDLFTTKTATTTPINDKDDMEMALQHIDRITAQGKAPRQVPSVGGNHKNNMISFHNNAVYKPILVRNPLPYHYPIPIRPVVVYRPRGASPFNNLQSPPVHLNTPKMMVPLEMAGAKPFQLVDLAVPNKKKQLQHKQQQKQLNAARVSKFPLTNDREALVDDQHANAIEKALAEDEDLKNIMGSTETLK